MSVDWRQEGVVEAVRRGALRGLTIAGNDVRNEILRRILATTKTGRIYRRRSGEHRASAPGEAPASDTGTLVRGIAVTVNPQTLSVRINSGAAHSLYLEFGTPTIEPRPHLRVSLAAQQENIKLTVGREIGRELQSLRR